MAYSIYDTFFSNMEYFLERDIDELKTIAEDKAVLIPIYERKIEAKEGIAVDVDILNKLTAREKELLHGIGQLKKYLQNCQHSLAGAGLLDGAKNAGPSTRITDFDPTLFEQSNVGAAEEETNGNRG